MKCLKYNFCSGKKYCQWIDNILYFSGICMLYPTSEKEADSSDPEGAVCIFAGEKG